jgi:hypothetical protein
MYMSLPSESSPWQKKHRCRNGQAVVSDTVGAGAREEEEEKRLKEAAAELAPFWTSTTSFLAVARRRGRVALLVI